MCPLSASKRAIKKKERKSKAGEVKRNICHKLGGRGTTSERTRKQER